MPGCGDPSQGVGRPQGEPRSRGSGARPAPSATLGPPPTSPPGAGQQARLGLGGPRDRTARARAARALGHSDSGRHHLARETRTPRSPESAPPASAPAPCRPAPRPAAERAGAGDGGSAGDKLLTCDRSAHPTREARTSGDSSGRRPQRHLRDSTHKLGPPRGKSAGNRGEDANPVSASQPAARRPQPGLGGAASRLGAGPGSGRGPPEALGAAPTLRYAAAVCTSPAEVTQKRLPVRSGTFKWVVSYLCLGAGDPAGSEADSSFTVLPWGSENFPLYLVSLPGARGPQRRGGCRVWKGPETRWKKSNGRQDVCTTSTYICKHSEGSSI
ncbi:glutathione S-transferase 3, mitochondrial isoform X1 [Pteropus medius]|uniref:microsomal glutathione S-transferase 3 isoform X1 n=1 Tax=Pteropus vampyrus TaxID=132908 RepID=UPI00196B07A6|nr:microsomal glutathione S-transferase 3 isoform X1 [Pteropus giganteus]